MKKLITLTAILGLVALWSGTALAHEYMPAGPFHDYVNIGDYLLDDAPVTYNPSSTEVTHNLQGWGAIQPFWGQGNYGGFNTTGEFCRGIWHVYQNPDCTHSGTGGYVAPETYPCDTDPVWAESGGPDAYGCGDPDAAMVLDFGSPGGTKTLYVRYLDGGGGATTDDFDLYVGGDPAVFVDTQGSAGGGEVWKVVQLDVSAHSDTTTVRFDCLGSNGSWTDQWAQCCIDQVGITIEYTDPILAPVAVDADPINCSGSKLVNVHLTPGDTEIRGYSVTVACDAPLTFDPDTDVTFFEVPSGVTYLSDTIEVVPGHEYILDYAIAGGSVGISAEADVLSVAVHGATTGTGTVSITAASLAAMDGTPITPVDFTATATVEVDCTPSAAPTLGAEPDYTAGTANTLSWSDESASGATAYLVQRATDAGFTTDLADSGWIAGLSHEFTGLTDGQLYYYRVKSRDALANESGWSGAESSTQDDTAPGTAADIDDGDGDGYVDSFFDVTYTGDDTGSGLASVELFYRIDGGAWTSYGVFIGATLEFDASALAEGTYDVYTVGTDAVGNEEAAPGVPDDTIIVDKTPPETHVDDLGPFHIDSFFDITFTVDLEAGSGLRDAHLWYKKETTGAWTDYGTFVGNSITFDTATTGGDGTYFFYSLGTDNVGNVELPPSGPDYDATTVVDTVPPETSVDALPPYHIVSDFDVTFTVDLEAGSGLADAHLWYKKETTGVWTDYGAFGGAPIEFDTTTTGGDGTYFFHSLGTDNAGNVESPPSGPDYDATTTVDTDPPVFASMVINDDDDYTNDPNVTLTSDVTGADQMQFQNEGGAWSGWEPYAATTAWALVGADGLKQVNAQYRDLAGNLVEGFDEITLDTTGPTFTSLVINDDDAFTANVNVTLTNDVTDAVEMRFRNDGGTWSDWTAYNATHPWIIGAVEGDRYVQGEYRDAALNTVGGEDFITYDVTAPDPVADLSASRGNDKVALTWTNPDQGETGLEVWRAVWHTGDDVTSAYPEYDDLDTDEIPTLPADRDAAIADPAWTMVHAVDVLVDVPNDAYTDAAARGIYWYVIYAVDGAGNWGAGADATSINYLLGDVAGDNGDVDGGDISVLGAHYGTQHGGEHYDNTCDVGPTDDFSGSGLPQTDNLVDFEDLMIFALNWDVTVTKTLPGEGGSIARFVWTRIDGSTWSLALAEPCANLKGLNLTADLPADAVQVLGAGALLGDQESPYFLQNISRNGLDAGLALLGRDACITGQGELLRLTLSGEYDLSEIGIAARGADNRPLEHEIVETTDLPAAPDRFELSANYPNPFNPSTKIDFALPESRHVRLSIFAVDGRRIATLTDETLPAGRYTVTWTGRSDAGEFTASGMYFYRLEAGDFVRTEKMTLLK